MYLGIFISILQSKETRKQAAMITMYKGNAENSETSRLTLTCDRCQAHVETDVPLDNIRDHGDTANDSYIERARAELAQICPHMEAELTRHENESQSSSQGMWNPPQRRPSSYTDHS